MHLRFSHTDKREQIIDVNISRTVEFKPPLHINDFCKHIEKKKQSFPRL